MSRADIRAYFDAEAAAYPAPAGLRHRIVDDTSRPDIRPARTRLAATVAAGVAVALAAGLVGVGTYYQHKARPILPVPLTLPSPSAKPTAPPAGLGRLVEIDFVDTKSGFALLCTHPGGGQCQYSVSRTTDGGAHWSKAVNVGAQVLTGDSGHHIHFANGRDGLMYGNNNGYVTHDGGHTWRSVNIHFLEIVSIAGTSPMWMVLDPCAKGVVCPFQVLESTDGATTWKVAASLPDSFVPAEVVAFGDRGLLMSTFGTGDVLITRDSGTTWKSIAGRCRADTLANRVATADGAEIWQMCTPLPPDPSHSTLPWTNAVQYTQDGGRHWIWRQLPAGTIEIIAAFGYGRVIEATDTAALVVTQDGGRTWTQFPSGQPFFVVSLSWLPDGHAWAADQSGAIWTTADYGVTWGKIRAQP